MTNKSYYYSDVGIDEDPPRKFMFTHFKSTLLSKPEVFREDRFNTEMDWNELILRQMNNWKLHFSTDLESLATSKMEVFVTIVDEF